MATENKARTRKGSEDDEENPLVEYKHAVKDLLGDEGVKAVEDRVEERRVERQHDTPKSAKS